MFLVLFGKMTDESHQLGIESTTLWERAGGHTHPDQSRNQDSTPVSLLVEATKGPFIATQLNSTRRRVELSCVAINGPLSSRYRCTWGAYRSIRCQTECSLDPYTWHRRRIILVYINFFINWEIPEILGHHHFRTVLSYNPSFFPFPVTNLTNPIFKTLFVVFGALFTHAQYSILCLTSFFLLSFFVKFLLF